MTEEPPRGTGGKGDRDEAALDDLRWHWGSAYEMSFDGNRGWTARRHATGRILASDTPYGLRDLIVADYSARPRPAGGPVTGESPARRDRP